MVGPLFDFAAAMSPQALTEYLHRNIPLTAALGAQVTRCAPEEVEIAAPLAPNLNHRSTAFGGSLAALSILSGWAVLHLALERERIVARLVVQRSETDFSAAVTGKLVAVSKLPEAAWQKFLATLRKHRRARIAVETEIRQDSGPAVSHVGTYVALT
jgi:thioesterase domain-containing protein